MTAALDLADNRFGTVLVEAAPNLGGHAATFGCKATDECSNCSVCTVPGTLRRVGDHPGIEIRTGVEVVGMAGEAGAFRVRMREHPRFVDVEKCIACGRCAEVCPAEPAAAYLPSPQTVPYAYVVDRTRCLRVDGDLCTACADECPTGAIDFAEASRTAELEVGAIVVATGFEAFDAHRKAGLGYGKHPNILTGLDLEQRLAEIGGIMTNGDAPSKIAFIQCVGSRDEHIGRGYCSKVCCKYAIRLSKVIQHHHAEAEITIFYMDLQTAGKGFGEFYEECKDRFRFVRGLPVEVRPVSNDGLEVRYEDVLAERAMRETFDTVVLSVGMGPREDASRLADLLGIDVDEYGFLNAQDPLKTCRTNVEGIFLAGACQGSKTIADCMAHATQAATQAIDLLAHPLR